MFMHGTLQLYVLSIILMYDYSRFGINRLIFPTMIAYTIRMHTRLEQDSQQTTPPPPSPHEVGQGIVVSISGYPAVRPSFPTSVFRFRTMSRKTLSDLFSYRVNTSLRKWRCAFRGLCHLIKFFTNDFAAIIDYN